jgi:uncharacterized protein YjbI with pentapeptide repeats
VANKEQVKLLKRGAGGWNAWRKANPKINPDLSVAAISATNLTGANLTRTNLNSANLTGAEFNDTTLANLDLSSCRGLETCKHLGPSIFDIRTSIGCCGICGSKQRS